jgi:heme-binding NEAT domain protein
VSVADNYFGIPSSSWVKEHTSTVELSVLSETIHIVAYNIHERCCKHHVYIEYEDCSKYIEI